MRFDPGKFYIGCSGYYYPQWKGKFYPEGTGSRGWLSHYSTVFNAVELNGTFYRTPTVANLKKNAAATPVDFRFSAKVSRYITHILRLKNCRPLIRELEERLREGLGNKLAGLLFQLPPSFSYSGKNLELILKNIPPGERQVIELRNTSWWNEEVFSEFKKAAYTFCNSDYPGIENRFLTTSGKFYLRLHGRPQLFKSSYSDPELRDMAKKIPQGCSAYHIYFNNTYYQAAYLNATRLRELLGKKEKKSPTSKAHHA